MCALRRCGHVDVPRALHRHEHAEPDRLAVRRPTDVGDALIDARHLRRRALGVHPAYEELHPARSAAIDVGDARTVWRPPRAAAFREEAILGPVRVHDPQLGVEPVLELVDVSTRVDDLRAVRRDLWIGDLLEVEELLDGEQGIGLPLLRDKRRARREQRDEHAGSSQGSGRLEHETTPVEGNPRCGTRPDHSANISAENRLGEHGLGVTRPGSPGRARRRPAEGSPTPS